MVDFRRDWPVFVLLAGVIVFFAYVIIQGNRSGKADKEDKSPGKDKSP